MNVEGLIIVKPPKVQSMQLSFFLHQTITYNRSDDIIF